MRLLLSITYIFVAFFNVSYADETLVSAEEYEKKVQNIKSNISEEEQEELTNLINRGEVLFEEQKNEEAIESYNMALEILDKYSLFKQKLKILINLANIEYSSDRPLSAIKHFQQATNLSKKIGNTEHLGYLFSRLSYLYYNSDLNLSKTYIELAIKENTKKQNLGNLAENYYNLSVINKKLGLLNEAKDAQRNFTDYEKHIEKAKFFRLSEATQNNEYRLDVETEENVKTTEYADIQILNKINGFTYVYETRIGAKMQFKNIEIITRSCLKSAPEDSPENTLLIEVHEIQKEEKNSDVDHNNVKIQLFNGWMFSSTPSLNSLEHPIYDIRLLNCRVKKI